MSGGKPVFVSVMYSPSARMRWGSDQIVVLCLREETSFSRRSRTCVRAGQVSMLAGTTLVRSRIVGRLGLGFS